MVTATPSNDASSTTPNIVTLNEIETITNTPSFQKDLIDAIAKGFAAFHQGDFFAAPIQTLGVAVPFCFGEGVENYAAQTCVKSGYFRNNPYYVIKVASGGYPLPANSGLMQVYSQQTGRLVALLLDEGILTELRTAAVGALAFTLFAPRNMTCIGMVGTGVQARFQLQWLANVTTCRKVVVYGRSPEKSQTLQRELQESGWNVTLANKADELLSQCDVIVTTTCARQPILGTSCSHEATAGRCHRTKLITCIGADAPGKTELDPALVKEGHVLVADSLQQTRERGEFQTWCANNNKDNNNKDKLVSLGQILAEKRSDLKRNKSNEEDEHDNRLFIFDSSGVALQDCVIAQMVYEALTSPPSS